jgi:hypothetical protein
VAEGPLGGGCLCGAVRFTLHGELRDVVICHCRECLRWHGGPGAYTSLPEEALELTGADALRFVPSPASDAGAERGFCRACGSSLIWRAPGRGTVSVAAGALDQPTGLRTTGHIYDDQRADWEHVDELPRAPGSTTGY